MRFFLFVYLLLHPFVNTNAQVWDEEISLVNQYGSDIYFKKSVDRLLNLSDTANKYLQHIYCAENDSVFTIQTIFREAIEKNKLSVYNNTSDSAIALTTQENHELLRLLCSGKEISNCLQINTIIIEEDWYITDKTKQLNREYIWFKFCHKKDSNKTIAPVFSIKAADFLRFSDAYYLNDKGNKLNLSDYFQNRYYKSKIIATKNAGVKHRNGDWEKLSR